MTERQGVIDYTRGVLDSIRDYCGIEHPPDHPGRNGSGGCYESGVPTKTYRKKNVPSEPVVFADPDPVIGPIEPKCKVCGARELGHKHPHKFILEAEQCHQKSG
jgi:hypothetical protein